MSCDVGEVTERLENEQIYIQCYIQCSRAHSPIFPSLHLRHSSFSNPSVALHTSQLILQPSVASPTSQLILQPFFRFSYVADFSLSVTWRAAHVEWRGKEQVSNDRQEWKRCAGRPTIKTANVNFYEMMK